MAKITKYKIQIPKNIEVVYCKKNWIVIFIGPIKKTSLKLGVKLLTQQSVRCIEVTNEPISSVSNVKKKNLKALQGTTAALIRYMVLEASGKFYQYIKFVGIGYRAFSMEGFDDKLYMFKLGYSHFIYFKIPEGYELNCQKFTKILISGESYQNLCQISAVIRSCRKPDPYKGKGVLYENEKINLKIGKRI